MPSNSFASLAEDLSDQPIQAAIRDKLKDLIGAGSSPAEVSEAALVVAAALCLDVEGMEKAAIRLLTAGTALANACPELQNRVAAARERAGAARH